MADAHTQDDELRLPDGVDPDSECARNLMLAHKEDERLDALLQLKSVISKLIGTAGLPIRDFIGEWMDGIDEDYRMTEKRRDVHRFNAGESSVIIPDAVPAKSVGYRDGDELRHVVIPAVEPDIKKREQSMRDRKDSEAFIKADIDAWKKLLADR